MTNTEIIPSPKAKSAAQAFEKFISIVERLRNPNGGCPWDIEQTWHSISHNLIEEGYEVIDALGKGSDLVKEELGDLLSVWGLFSQIGSDDKKFEIAGVIDAISEKLIRRHPHVFGETQVRDSKDVMTNWEKIKQTENVPSNGRKGVLDSVPTSMPALLRAQRVSEKCARVGFEWRDFSDIKAKVLEEVLEFTERCTEKPSDKSGQEEEFGDILFALVQVARRSGFSAEEALRTSTNKFTRRFKEMEEIAYKRGSTKGVVGMTLEEMDTLWNEVKERE